MAIPCAVLMCHAPIVIPQIAGVRASQCEGTTRAMRAAATALVRQAPEVVVIISPHTPRDRRRFGVVSAAHIGGDFSRFGAPEVAVRLPGAPHAASELERAARKLDLLTCATAGDELDHGALVPLFFMVEAGWSGSTLLLALPYPGTGTEPRMGLAIAKAAHALGESWCVLASGDMSHRLTHDAPAGYHSRARDFDATFRSLIDAGQLERACSVDPGLRDVAAEDVVDSTAVAAAAVGFDAAGHRTLHYEAPFGVGYLEAVLHERPLARSADAPRAVTAQQHPLLSVARHAIDAALHERRYDVPALSEPWVRPRGVFVTLRIGGELRGCIGHVEPQHATLAHEVASCAIGAALHDPRFAAMTPLELADVTIELSLLSPCERVVHLDELDAERYGVVVSAGHRRGVLLPAVAGIHSVHDQLRVALRKAGLTGQEDVQLERFEVDKLEESPLDPAASGGHARRPRHELQ